MDQFLTPIVSVIVPNYNHAPYLRQRIDSILSQTYQDFELILLDDNSTDDSRSVLKEYEYHPKVSQIVFNEQNSGSPFAQWNKGIELAQGDWIWIAESDDWAEPNFLETLMNEVSSCPNVGLAYAMARYVCEGEEMWEMKQTGEVFEYKGVGFIKNNLVFSNVIYNVSMAIFRKDIFEKIDQSLYNTMRLCGDWFFYTQLCQYADVLEVRKICSNYRVHKSNTSSDAERKGLTFLEGLSILDYIKQQFDVSRYAYTRSWGQFWAKYQKKYTYPLSVNLKITKRVLRSDVGILFWYIVYKIRLMLK